MAFSMRIAYFDCFSGVSGDMCLGALVDTGLPLADLAKGLEGLRLQGFSLRSRRVARGALSGTKVDVLIGKGRDRMVSLRDVRWCSRRRNFRSRCPTGRCRASSVVPG